MQDIKTESDVVSSFDDEQKRALNAILDQCLSTDEFIFPIVDGPPGTGKTTVGTASVRELLREDPKSQVLYMCYTNFAAERARESLGKLGLGPDQVIRLTPNPRDRNWSEGVVGFKHDFSDLSANDLRRLKSCPVLLCTLHSSRRGIQNRRAGARLIVDEFSQVDPGMFFATINRVRNCNPDGYALLGDPKQLPVITTQPLLRPNIAAFVMRRKPYTPHKLVTQHRMHEDICAAVNSLRTALGTYMICSGEEVKERDLVALGYTWDRNSVPENYRAIIDPQHPLVLVNSDKLSGGEEQTFRGSWRNVAEAKLAAKLTRLICESYKDSEGPLNDIAILSPYAAQVVEIRQNLPTDLQSRCATIYKAQGREYHCVVLSFVRSNPEGFIGFLEESELKAQTYVACSRAEAKLIVVLSFQTFFGKSHKDFDYLNETKTAFKFEGPL
jgi:hypothetical protein